MLKGVFNKTLVQIFLALLLVICIMFASNYIIFRNSMEIMYEQTDENNRLVVNGVIQSFEECFKELNDIIYTIGALPYQVYDPQGHDNINMHNAFLLISNATQLISQNYIEDFVIFFKDSDLAITSKGTESFKRVFTERYRNSSFAPEYWRNFAVTGHPMKLIPSADYSEVPASGEIYKRELLAVVGSNQTRKSDLNIVVFVDLQKLYKRVSRQSLMRESSLIVLDQDKNAIISTDKNYDIDALEGIYFNTGSETVIQKDKYEYHCVKSEYNGFVYVNKIPQRYEDTNFRMRFNRSILLFTTVAGIIISLFLSLYLYSPVRKILMLIGLGENEKPANHYKHIYNSIERIQKENQLIKNRMDKLDEEVRRSVFFKMIDDINYYKNLKDQIDTYFKVVFYSSHFMMVSFDFKYEGKSKENGDGFLKTGEPEDMAYIIQEILNKKTENSVVFYVENMQFIALIGLQSQNKREAIIGNLRDVVEELKGNTFKDYKIMAAASRLYTEVKQCKEAFRDIKMCFSYRNVRTSDVVVDFEKIDYNYDIYMPLDFNEKLLNYILSSNTNQSIDMINEVFDRNIANNINYIKLENIVSDIFNSIINALALHGFDRTELLAIENDFIRKMENLSDYDEMRGFLVSVVERSVKRICEENPNKLNKEFILQYIHLHYAENLYLNNMAEIMGTTPKYFSNFFKKAFGVSFVKYLNKIRMAHAKELLKNSEIPISEIGEKVGFFNSSTFTSTFKQYCGISPTEYRKEYKV